MSLPRYPQYKDSGDASLGKIPSHWCTRRLKKVLAEPLMYGANEVADDTTPDNPRFIRITDIGADGELRDDTFRSLPAETARHYLLKDGDILLARSGATVGKSFIYRSSWGTCCFAGYLIKAAVDATIAHADFIYACFQADFYWRHILGEQIQATIQNVSAERYAQLVVPCPPLDEQIIITAFLAREAGKIDALIAEQEKLLTLLAEKRQATISHAVTRGLNPDAQMKDSGVAWLGHVPAHWEMVRLGQLFREAAESGDDTLPILSVSIHDGVSDKELSDDELDRKVTRSDDRSKYKKVACGDLVYNMMRAWQGGFGTVLTSGMVSPAYVVARPAEGNFLTGFIEQLLRTPQGIQEMKRYSRGITDFRLRLYWDEFKNIKIALPPLHEQEKIMASFGEAAKYIDGLAEQAEHAIDLLKERRSALIAAAVTGKIDVRGVMAQNTNNNEEVAA
jgi:type I restriction enzyme S subunit